MVKCGFNAQGFQRFKCRQCGKTMSDIPARPLPDLRTAPGKVTQVVSLLAEGLGIRSAERLAGLNRRTVLAILKEAGEHCSRLLQNKVRDLAVDRFSKLIITHLVGKRTAANSLAFMEQIKAKVPGRFQLTTDGFAGYTGQTGQRGAVRLVFGQNVDYATEIKTYDRPESAEGYRQYSPPVCVAVRRRSRIGNPNPKMICNNHVERMNLSVRLFNRRFTRLTNGFSRTLENHRHSIALLVAHFNFCRKHSAHGMTPAMAAGLADHVWTVGELLSAAV
jgi:IS1 family transposase